MSSERFETMADRKHFHFIDVFAGCGGLSLGLIKAGMRGLFAVEKSPMAFATLKQNLIDGDDSGFIWPEWLPENAMTCEELLAGYSPLLKKLKGSVDLVVGGPPCQGFSTAGKRDPADPRNKMTEQYLKLVELVKPTYIVIENVAGFDMEFLCEEEGINLPISGKGKGSYAQYIAKKLVKIGYTVSPGLVNCADFGVPQNRRRFLMICELSESPCLNSTLFNMLIEESAHFSEARGLPTTGIVSVKEAISDLEVNGNQLLPNTDSGLMGFFEIKYQPSKAKSSYQKLMRQGSGALAPNSLRLPRHRPETIKYFKKIKSCCRPGRPLSLEERAKVGTLKHTTTLLDGGALSPTITTLPDDIIHYSEPRILTVRECARLQSFPDWFSFQGKYTTGGKKRKIECPRYTQVGNAVPPLLSEALGELLLKREAARQSLKSAA